MSDENAPITRKRAKKISCSVGPYVTVETFRDAGKDRKIEASLTPFGVVYRLSGQSETYTLPHPVGVQKAMSISAGINTGPRDGRLKRGEQHI